jgi:hypothetical protein
MNMTQQRLKTNKSYSTTDLALATALSLFYPVEAIDRQDPHKAHFQFKRTDELDKLINAYWHGEMRVEPQGYFNSLKSIKARLYSEGR